MRPINALGGSVQFVEANARPTAPAVGGTLRVTGLNLLNFFNTFTGCTFGSGGAVADCRGAENAAEFDRQWPKTVAAIVNLNTDVIGINEIENDGYGSTSAIAFLVDRLNAATAPGTFAFIDVDTKTSQVNALGTDAIKVGLLYKPAKVTPVGTTAALNSVAFVNAGDSGPRNRASLAQAFEQNSNGARFIVNVNHLKSKGSACDAPDANDGQGNCAVVRANAATQLGAWLASNPTGTNDPDIIMLGDYNSYAKEDAITNLKTGGFTNLVESLLGPNSYSYVFNGQWGYLDYALSSTSMLTQVVGVAEHHINADEPSVLDYNTNFKSPAQVSEYYAPDQYRVSDHDPIVVGLNLTNPSVPDTVAPVPTLNTPVPAEAVALSGLATDTGGSHVIAVQVILYRPFAGGQFWNGTAWQAGYTAVNATLASPGTDSTTWTYLFDPPQSGGTYYVAAVAIDGAYNYAVSAFKAVTIPDTVAPTAVITAPAEGAIVAGKVTIAGTATDNSSLYGVQVAIYRAADAQFWNGSGWQSTWTTFTATLAAPGTGSSRLAQPSISRRRVTTS